MATETGSPRLVRRHSAAQRKLSTASTIQHQLSPVNRCPPTPKRAPPSTPLRRSSLWPDEIPVSSPTRTFNPKEYLTALSELLAFTNTQMSAINLDGLIWAFNRATARNDRIAMRQLGTTMLPVLDKVHHAYRTFCETRGTFDEQDVWKMVMNLCDEGSDFWDVVDELGDLIEIMEGEDTEEFWKSLEEVVTKN